MLLLGDLCPNLVVLLLTFSQWSITILNFEAEKDIRFLPLFLFLIKLFIWHLLNSTTTCCKMSLNYENGSRVTCYKTDSQLSVQTTASMPVQYVHANVCMFGYSMWCVPGHIVVCSKAPCVFAHKCTNNSRF